LIWIVGEYAEKISNADEILAGFVDGFSEEFTQVCPYTISPRTRQAPH
jgi:AP-1 complex subunit beta-1